MAHDNTHCQSWQNELESRDPAPSSKDSLIMWSQWLTLYFVHLFTLCIFIFDTRSFSIIIAFLPKSDFGNLKTKEFPLCQKEGWDAFLQHLTRRWEYHWTTRKDDCWKGFTYELSLPVMHAVLFLTPKQPAALIWQINNWKRVVTSRMTLHLYGRFFRVFSLGFWQMVQNFGYLHVMWDKRRREKPYRIQDQNGQSLYCFQTKTAQKQYSLG